jgi:hypothetical protein
MKNLHKLLKGEHILGLTNVHFEKDSICSACQAGTQVGVHHPHKMPKKFLKNEASSSRHSTHIKMPKKFLMHQMSIIFHLRLLMLLMCSLTNQAK